MLISPTSNQSGHHNSGAYTAWGHLTDAHVGGTLWLKAGVAAAIWVLVPMVAGAARVLRRPID